MNESKAQQILKSMSPQEQDEAKKLVQGVDFDALFKDFDLGVVGKRIAKTLIQYAREKFMPKLQQTNATLAFIIESALAALEAQLGDTP